MQLPYDPAIPLLGIYPKKTKTLKKKLAPQMFIHTFNDFFLKGK